MSIQGDQVDKEEIRKQWDNDPCGSNTVENLEPGTLAYYRAVRSYRYNVYAPWFDEVMSFSEWHKKDILEIGVGLGSDHFRFGEQGNRMNALDLSAEHLKHTSRHLELEGLRTMAVYGDAEKMPFEDNSFDLVYSFGVIHHTPHTEAAVTEIYRVLRPGGVAIIGLYHRDSLYFLSTILVNGILKGGLWRKGWRRLLSEIEYRSNPDSAMPLVKVFSRGQARKLFASFRDIQITTCHVDSAKLQKLLPLSRLKIERLLGWAGWYLVVKMHK